MVEAPEAEAVVGITHCRRYVTLPNQRIVGILGHPVRASGKPIGPSRHAAARPAWSGGHPKPRTFPWPNQDGRESGRDDLAGGVGDGFGSVAGTSLVSTLLTWCEAVLRLM